MDEKLKKALECCSRWNCCACPMVSDVNCTKNLPAEAKQYIDDLEERLAIMQESMAALEKRCKALEALEQRCKALEALEKRNEPIEPTLNESHSYVSNSFNCGKCGHTIRFHAKYCEECGQAVKWNG